MVNSSLAILFTIALSSLAVLCVAWPATYSDGKMRVYSVEGQVLVNGSPTANVHVAFHAVDSKFNPICPVGITDRAGNFILTSKTRFDGAPAGDYQVTFFWFDTNVDIDECECPDPLIDDRFRGIYAHPETSGYDVTVKASKAHLRFNLWRPRDVEFATAPGAKSVYHPRVSH